MRREQVGDAREVGQTEETLPEPLRHGCAPKAAQSSNLASTSVDVACRHACPIGAWHRTRDEPPSENWTSTSARNNSEGRR